MARAGDAGMGFGAKQFFLANTFRQPAFLGSPRGPRQARLGWVLGGDPPGGIKERPDLNGAPALYIYNVQVVR